MAVRKGAATRPLLLPSWLPAVSIVSLTLLIAALCPTQHHGGFLLMIGAVVALLWFARSVQRLRRTLFQERLTGARSLSEELQRGNEDLYEKLLEAHRQEVEAAVACSSLESKLQQTIASDPWPRLPPEEAARVQRSLAKGSVDQRQLGRLAQVLALCVRWSYLEEIPIPADTAESRRRQSSTKREPELWTL
jgi:hypothetical protein